MDSKKAFRDFFILLKSDKWFNSISDYKPLDRINGLCNKSISNTWEYNLVNLEFKNIDVKRHVRPLRLAKLANDGDALATLVLNLSCNNRLNNDPSVIEDPIENLAVRFVIKLEYYDNGLDDLKLSQSSWHLDKHDAEKVVSTSHPLYHYEFGGNELTKREEFDYGDFFLVDSPRIMHPPLDIILAIDFVLKNFYAFKEHSKLTSKPLYQRHIDEARKRIWRPYIISLASHFHDFKDEYKMDKVFASNILQCAYNPSQT